ncbi:hypothetical protein AZE42_08067 [Rhizopogon vesiculosus]|uniref:Uncharacterized protein n=1 Tax=Rhizopogon vesiculosus TaxID=180088 RepID=A0A1J8PTZ4_9AGAM|nr:hypothetical protein AZE42_08067 [Rhizopogon vesiculosus]
MILAEWITVHNAGIFLESYVVTPDGVQEIVMVNHIVLTRSLQLLLDQTAAEPNSDVRIVIVSSDVQRIVSGTPRFRNLDDLNTEYKDVLFPAFARYCMTKFANTLYASELQRRLTATGSRITVMSLHPGGVCTYFNQPSIPYYQFILKPIMFLLFPHPDKGAYNSVFAAASEEVAKEREKFRGAYLKPVGKVSKLTKMARDEGLQKNF